MGVEYYCSSESFYNGGGRVLLQLCFYSGDGVTTAAVSVFTVGMWVGG